MTGDEVEVGGGVQQVALEGMNTVIQVLLLKVSIHQASGKQRRIINVLTPTDRQARSSHPAVPLLSHRTRSALCSSSCVLIPPSPLVDELNCRARTRHFLLAKGRDRVRADPSVYA